MRNEAPETCAWCKGSGYSETESLWDLAGARMKCPVCNGQGSILVIQPAKMCSTCNGNGRVSGFLGAESKCSICGGSGWAFTKHEEDLESKKFEQEAQIRAQNRQMEYNRQIEEVRERAALRKQREYEDEQRRTELDSLTQQKQNSVTELLSKADYYISNNLRNDALKCLEEALTIDPRNSKAWIKKGWILEYLQKKDEALRCYVEAIWINPNDMDAWIGKGRLSTDPKDSVECRNKIDELDAAFYDPLKKEEIQQLRMSCHFQFKNT
jgi:tetratricopeptide (TPR) repeat protein